TAATAGNTFAGVQGYAFVQGATYYSQALGFSSVIGFSGGTGSSAYLGLPAGNGTEVFGGVPGYSFVQGSNFSVVAGPGFGFTDVVATSAGSGTADLSGSPGDDVFTEVAPATGKLTGAGYSVQVTGFGTVSIKTTAGGGSDSIVRAAVNYVLEVDGPWQG